MTHLHSTRAHSLYACVCVCGGLPNNGMQVWLAALAPRDLSHTHYVRRRIINDAACRVVWGAQVEMPMNSRRKMHATRNAIQLFSPAAAQSARPNGN